MCIPLLAEKVILQNNKHCDMCKYFKGELLHAFSSFLMSG